MFRKLKMELCGRDLNQKILCKAIERSQTYMTMRMTGKVPFDLADVYGICDYLSLPYEKIAEYFPKNGIDEERKST